MTKEGLNPSKIDQILAKVKPKQVVALVDDDPVTHDLIGRALHDEGYEVHHFRRGEEFLEKLNEISWDAVVVEAILPGVSGLALIDALRPKNLETMIPVLVLSEKEDVRAKLLAFRRGACDYLTKPVFAEEVAVRIRSLTRMKILTEMTRLSSISDPLTSVYNRRFLLTCLEKEIHRVKRYKMQMSCLLLDVDDFHQINSKSGEKFGDFLLKELAGIMLRNLRASDLMGRIGSDEFIALLPHTSKEQSMVVAKRLRCLVQEREFGFEDKKIKLSLSMGIASCLSEEAIDAHDVLEKAEGALTKAKAVGRGETAVF